MPNQFLGVLAHTMAISGLSRVRTELFHLLVIPFLTQHPVQADRQSPCQGDLGNLPPPPHHQMEVPVAPFRNAACSNLRCFHQQEAHKEFPCLVICPSLRRLPLDSSNGTSPR